MSIAAATLGRRTLEPQYLHSLLASKFESALRVIAAEMTMADLGLPVRLGSGVAAAQAHFLRGGAGGTRLNAA